MNGKLNSEDSYNSLLLLDEIAKEEQLSQRDISKRLGIALGLVNSYVKNMVSKGHIRVKSFPKNRYKYLLTPKGFAEKTRLTYRHLHYFTNLYATARKDFRELFSRLEREGVKKVVFCGIDEVAEIAYLSLNEIGIKLDGVFDEGDNIGRDFFSLRVNPLDDMPKDKSNVIIITSVKRREQLKKRLAQSGIGAPKIYTAGQIGR